MKELHTGKASGSTGAEARATDWKRLGSMTDEEIRRGIAADPDAARRTRTSGKRRGLCCRSRNKP
jgi:hypothetical protein